MIAAWFLLAQLAGASPVPMPPQDWSNLRPLPIARDLDDGPNLAGFVRSEVQAGRCSAATVSPQGYVLNIDLAVLIGPSGQPRRVVPRAISCPAVEQYAAGLVSSMTRGNILPGAIVTDGWYRTHLTFAWPA